MNKIDKNIIKIVNNLIRKEARPEALLILEKCSELRFNEFMTYIINDKENVCCMVLDVAKSELVGSNQMIHTEEDYFGFPYLKIKQKEL